MAWQTVGTSNADMCEKLKDCGVLRDDAVYQAFCLTDRGDFCSGAVSCYHDRPFRNELVHLSAPHMYAMVLDALDLQPGQVETRTKTSISSVIA